MIESMVQADPRFEDWRWQMANRIGSAEALGEHLRLSAAERAAFASEGLPPVAVTPYWLSLIDRSDPLCPIRRQALPDPEDVAVASSESPDPLGELALSPVTGLIHRYPDRVLLLSSMDCPVRCRHCNRRARRAGEFLQGEQRWEAALSYLARAVGVREVILSGGDPLTIDDLALDRRLAQIARIGHVETIRIHSRALATCPMRVTQDLVDVLSSHGPLYLLTQFNHPREVTPAAVRACDRLAQAGIPLANQSVLLRGVNDSVSVLTDLSRALLRARVRPYYLFQLDTVVGTERFKTAVATGVDLVGALRGRLSGLGIPTFALDTPGGHGKVALLPESIVYRGPGVVRVRTWEGHLVDYPDVDPVTSPSQDSARVG